MRDGFKVVTWNYQMVFDLPPSSVTNLTANSVFHPPVRLKKNHILWYAIDYMSRYWQTARASHNMRTKVARDAVRLRSVAHEVSNILTYNIFERCVP